MHIAIDAHSVGTRLAGNETYSVNLIEALAQIDQTNRYTLYVTTPEAIDRFQGRWPNFQIRRTLPHTPFVRIPITLATELRRRPVDVLHVQYTAPPLAPCPVVVTVHDLSFEHLPETFNRRSRMQLKLTVRRSARRATQIITLSEYSRRDIVSTYGIMPERVTVTPAAAASHLAPVTDEAELKRVRNTYGIDGDYLLSLSSIQPRKNLTRLIAGYERLRRSRPNSSPRLVLAGKRGWRDSAIFRMAKQSAFAADIIFTGYVLEEDLAALYTGALCFVYPSYFEGFGLPITEAMQCGVPVIAGDRTSLPEVVGDAGLLVDPFDEQAIATAIGHLVENPGRREELRVNGLERAKAFSWLDTARLTLDVYHQAAGES